MTDLTDRQQEVLDQKIRLVEAGPGSGKTRSLVARFLQTSRETKRGVALLSFTNAAIDEVRRRTASNPGVLAAPNFVGTIDAFLNRFIVTPAEVPRLGRQPSYRPSWSDLPDHMAVLRLQAVPGVGVPLAAFRKTAQGLFVVNENQLRDPQRQYLDLIDAENRRPQLIQWAGNIINGLNQAGHYDAHTARVKAFEILSSPQGQARVERLCTRFEEILLDEAQDCNEAEFRVLERLGQLSRTVLVADPDQAIFEFRGSDPRLFINYRNGLLPDQKVSLGDNHRSTVAICSATSALRTGGQAAIVAVSDEPGAPVLVLKGSPTQQRQKFLDALGERDIPIEEAIVLSHNNSRARAVAGVGDPAGDSTARGNRLAAACYVLRQRGADARTRLDAITVVEDIILSLACWPADVARSGRDGKLAHAARDRQWLRRSAGALVGELMPVTERAAFATNARARLGVVLSELEIDHVNLSQNVQQPEEARWNKCMTPAVEASRLRYSTVHGAKGSEVPAVLLSLPAPLVADSDGRTVIHDWSAGVSSERLRVLYVGVSRAQRLLCIGAAMATADLVAELLAAAGVPHEVR